LTAGPLASALQDVPFLQPSGSLIAYRTVPLEALRLYSPDPLNTAGSLQTGGRYNTPSFLPGGHAALYLAENTAVAHAEARVITVVSGPSGMLIQPGTDQRPRLDIAVELHVGTLLDLTDPAVLRRLGLSPGDLLGAWFPLNAQGQIAPTQRLARAVLDSGRFEGLLYPSARFPGGRNYAVFPDRVPPERRTILDPGGDVLIFRRDRH